MSEKYNAALGAYELISKGEDQIILGIGTGSTTDLFTEHFLPKLRKRINSVFSSSNRTTNLLNNFGFQVSDYDPEVNLDFYVDGADEVDENLNLIKGGGGAHTNEKKLAKIAESFICIVDESKIVQTLGKFPLPIEIDINQNEKTLFELKKYSKNIVRRELLSDNNNYIYDLHDFKIIDPNKTETEILSITGVIDVGIFAINKPRIVIVGENSSYRLIES